MPDKKITLLLVVITLACLLIAVKTTTNNNYTSLINTLSVGFVISSIFYFIVVYLPAKQRRRRVYASMERQYQFFKRSCIDTFLILSSSQDYPEPDMLLDLDEFSRYFNNTNEANEKRWYAVTNGFQNDEYYLREIIYELKMLNNEIKFVTSAIDIHDEEVSQFLKGLSQSIHRFELKKADYFDSKSLSSFLWTMFTGWSFIAGQRKSDFIKGMIERIQ